VKTRGRSPTLITAVLPRTNLLTNAALILGFSLLTAACARIAFWLGPVPITGQTFAVLLAGALLGSKRGALSQLAYLAQGAIGLPVFAGGHGGVAYMLGPTGGYLWGFVAAAFVVGWLTERGWDRHVLTAALAMMAGEVVLYALGLSWLARFVPGQALLATGLVPFIPGDLLKLALAATLLPSGWLLLRRLGVSQADLRPWR